MKTLYLLAALTAAPNPPEEKEELASYMWSCKTVEAVQALNDAYDNSAIAERYVKDGTCVHYNGYIVAPVLRTVKSYRHRDGSLSSILEVLGPGERVHFIVIEDERTF